MGGGGAGWVECAGPGSTGKGKKCRKTWAWRGWGRHALDLPVGAAGLVAAVPHRQHTMVQGLAAAVHDPCRTTPPNRSVTASRMASTGGRGQKRSFLVSLGSGTHMPRQALQSSGSHIRYTRKRAGRCGILNAQQPIQVVELCSGACLETAQDLCWSGSLSISQSAPGSMLDAHVPPPETPLATKLLSPAAFSP